MNFKEMTFDVRPCTELSDFVCGARMFAKFFKDEIISNCSAECPAECSSIEYSITQTSSTYPTQSYLYYLLGQSDSLARKHFNKTAADFQEALSTARPDLVPSMQDLYSNLTGKLVALNIFYDDLVYTTIEESAKTSLIDLIAGMGGTVVDNVFFS